MPRRDAYHNAVRNALVKDGWTITHDPLIYPYRRTDVFIDLGAESALGAEKGRFKIAVEIKVFRGPSDLRDLEEALGQFRLYRFITRKNEPERTCYLALSTGAYQENFTDAESLELIAEEDLRLLVVDVNEEKVTRWIPSLSSES